MCIRDRPTGGLDVSVQARLLDLLRHLVLDMDLAVILGTHELAVARLLAHRLMVMYRGEVVETGLTDQAVSYTHLDVYKRQGHCCGLAASIAS